MTRCVHDKFAKSYLKDLLSSFGEVKTSYTVASEVRQIDVLFTPTPQLNASLENLSQQIGLLGDIAKTACVIEPFRNPPTLMKIRSCINKLFDICALLEREAKQNKQKLEETDLPYLWILAPTTSNKILGAMGVRENNQPTVPGVYESVEVNRTRIVVIHSLPKIPETLWLRILGKGNVQTQAIKELNSLPENDPSRQKAALWLSSLQTDLQNRKNLGKQNQELVVSISPILEKRLEQAKQEGIKEGIQETLISVVTLILSKRFGNLTPQLVQIINNLSLDNLESLSQVSLDFSSIEDLQAWLRAND